MISIGWVVVIAVVAFVVGFKYAEFLWEPLWKKAADHRDRYFWKWFRRQ